MGDEGWMLRSPSGKSCFSFLACLRDGRVSIAQYASPGLYMMSEIVPGQSESFLNIHEPFMFYHCGVFCRGGCYNRPEGDLVA